MSSIVALGLTTAILCGAWTWAAGIIGFLGWAGFSGCTSYFACPDKGLKGVISCICCTMSGVTYAMISIKLGGILTFPFASIIVTIVATYLMCVQNKVKLLSYIPGTFFGSFSTFAANGDPMIIPSILCGIILGLACDKSGQWLFKVAGKKEEN